MKSKSKKLFSSPQHWRVLSLLAIGALLIFLVYRYRVSQRPKELSPEYTIEGLALVQEMIDMVRKSPFGQSERGTILTNQTQELIRDGRIRFSVNMQIECLYRKEFGCQPVLYIGVLKSGERVLWPDAEAFARRIYHEVLHVVINSEVESKEEECDAFCAAEEAVSGVENRPPRYPVMKDGKCTWEWVNIKYNKTPSDINYKPLGYTLSELALKTGMNDSSPAK